MRWHLRNHNCKQILLGISHDAGYAPFLDEVVVTDDDKNRVTIIEGPPIVRELSATGLNIMNLKTIFRTEKLVDRTELPVERVVSPPSTNGSTNGGTTWAKISGTPAPAALPVVLKNGVSGTNGVKPPVTVKVTPIKVRSCSLNHSNCLNDY